MKNGKGRRLGNGGNPKNVMLNSTTKEELTKLGEELKQQTGMGIISYRQIIDILLHSYRVNNQ